MLFIMDVIGWFLQAGTLAIAFAIDWLIETLQSLRA